MHDMLDDFISKCTTLARGMAFFAELVRLSPRERTRPNVMQVRESSQLISVLFRAFA